MNTQTKYNKLVLAWLLVGLFMVMIQVLLGGVTRITESGLSITEWKPISGAGFPSSQGEWEQLYAQYQQIDQYKIYFNKNLTLSEFKYLYFWEWFHRNWARFIGIVFIIPYLLFSVYKVFTKAQMRKYAWLFLLGGLQGLAGWIMVASGLKQGNVFVEPLFLAIHFILALLTLGVIFMFLCDLHSPAKKNLTSAWRSRLPLILLIILSVQFIFGAFLAGLHAAKAAPTFPDINGHYFPPSLFVSQPFWINFLENPITVHFIHRGIAYLLVIFAFFWVYKLRFVQSNCRAKIYAYPILIALQIALGVLTLIYAREQQDYKIMSIFAISHQGIGMVIFIYALFMFRYLRKTQDGYLCV